MIRILVKYNTVGAIRLCVLTLTLLTSIFLLRKVSYLYKNILLLVEMDNICKSTI
ncbi:hypothetical protein [Fowlpox virus]|nr:hypothetical protein [Fowlpox virus]